MKKLYREWLSVSTKYITDEPFSIKFQYSCLSIILLFTLAIRLVSIDIPALDRTMWKEIDYITISTNYLQNGFNFFQPEITWPAEPPRITAMELPLVPYMAAIFYALFGFNSLTVRLIPLLSFLLMAIYIFRLAKREMNSMVGLIAALAASVFPLYHQFGNILFSEPIVIAMSVMAIFHFAQWMDTGQKKDVVIAVFAFSMAVSLKLTPLYMLLPLTWLAYRKYGLNLKSYFKLLAPLTLSLLLPIVWYSYAYFLTFNSIDVFGIFQGHDKMQTFTYLTRSFWYKKMFYRIAQGVLGGNLGFLLFVIGFMSGFACLKRTGLFYIYAMMIAIFFAIVAEGQIDAPYRQLTSIPFLAVFVSLGIIALFSVYQSMLQLVNSSAAEQHSYLSKKQLLLSFGIVLLILVFNYKAILHADPLEPSHKEEWRMAHEIKKIASDNAKIIALGAYTIHKGGNDLSPVLYYYTGLRGWTLQENEWQQETVERYIQKGASLLAAPLDRPREPGLKPFVQSLQKRYAVLYKNTEKNQILLDLTHLPVN
ncbi:hypothetical protein D3OALGB2SA_2638 [Olavius algarvensis associated proteobacterium Delta 3]|nr:hypothetical protein D3OALGB2SA_2638 [Olavius algarvensis associated proteobacterium Delta 3]